MKVKCIIHKIQNDELMHTQDGYRRWPAGDPEGRGGQFRSLEDVEAENREMTAELRNRTLRRQLTPEQERLSVSATRASEGIFRGIQNISNEVARIPTEKGKTEYGRYPDMSEAELQTTINRLQLENRYSDLVGDTKYTKSGSEKTREIMQTIGSVAGIAGSLAATVALVLQAFPRRTRALVVRN